MASFSPTMAAAASDMSRGRNPLALDKEERGIYPPQTASSFFFDFLRSNKDQGDLGPRFSRLEAILIFVVKTVPCVSRLT